MDPTLALCRELIARPSVTPEDAGCQIIMMERLANIGFRCRPLPFGDTLNFWAERGEGGAMLMFAGHTDVVPPGPEDAWRYPPFTPTLSEGLLYGRGSADMKGSLAAMVTACERFVDRHPQHRGRIGFLITSDEEGPAKNGTTRVVDWLEREQKPVEWCIVGEPSSRDRLGDVVKNGRRGSLNGTLRILGKQGHVAYPQLADNAIHRALEALPELASRHWDDGNAFFPATRLQFSNLASGTGATNVVPGELVAQFNFRFSTEQTAEDLKQAVAEILDRHGLSYELGWELSGNPFLTEPGALVAAVDAAIFEATGYHPELRTDGGTSDGRFIARLGCQIVELGPVNASIHQVDEHVRAGDLPVLSRIYEDTLRRLLVD